MEVKHTFSDEVQSVFGRCIEEFGFEVVADHYTAESFGNAYVELESRQFRFRICRDRCQVFVYVASFVEPGKWHYLENILEVIAKQPFNIPMDDQSKALDMAENLMRKYYADIGEAFGKDKYHKTKEELLRLANAHMKKTFPHFLDR